MRCVKVQANQTLDEKRGEKNLGSERRQKVNQPSSKKSEAGKKTQSPKLKNGLIHCDAIGEPKEFRTTARIRYQNAKGLDHL